MGKIISSLTSISNQDLDYGEYQGDINTLPSLGTYKYENIFKLHQDPSGQYYYNPLNAVYLPYNMDVSFYYHITLLRPLAWTVISYNEYGTIDLWWLICLTNNIFNPLIYPPNGSNLKIIKPEYLQLIINSINTQANS